MICSCQKVLDLLKCKKKQFPLSLSLLLSKMDKKYIVLQRFALVYFNQSLNEEIFYFLKKRNTTIFFTLRNNAIKQRENVMANNQ